MIIWHTTALFFYKPETLKQIQGLMQYTGNSVDFIGVALYYCELNHLKPLKSSVGSGNTNCFKTSFVNLRNFLHKEQPNVVLL